MNGAPPVYEVVAPAHSGTANATGGSDGGIYGQARPARPISAAVKKNLPMHWVVGAQDTPADGGSSGDYDAVRATPVGHAFTPNKD